MRKILSLILAALMLIIPTSAFAEATDFGKLSEKSAINDFVLATASASPVFDADFSAYTNQNPTITDKSGNNISVIQNAGMPLVNVEENGTNLIRYLNFKKAEKASEFVNFKVDKSSRIVGLSDMTIEIWAKPNITDDAGRVLFSLSKSTQSNSSYNATLTSKKMTVNLNGKTAECDIENYMNKWAQFTFVRSYDAEKSTATLKVYINGESVIDTSFAETAKADESEKFLYIGSYGDNKTSQWGIQYVGGISEFRVYDSSLSESNIGLNYIQQVQTYKDNSGNTDPDNPEQPTDPDNPEAPNEEGIIFDLEVGDSISSLKDDSGNNINVSTEGSVSVKQYGSANGDINYVAIDNRVDMQYVELTDSKLLNNPKTTIEFIMKTPDFVDENRWPKHFRICSTGNSSPYSLWFETGAADKGYFMMHDGVMESGKWLVKRTNVAATAQKNGDWMHLVITRSWDEETQKTTFAAYINGISVASAGKSDMTSPGDPTDASYYFGCFPGGFSARDGYRGGLAEYRIYNKILNGTEIEENYSAFASKYVSKKFELPSDEVFERETTSLTYKMAGGISPVSDITVTDALTGNPFKTTSTATDDGFVISFNQYLKYGQKLKIYSSSLDTASFDTVSKGNSEISAEIYNSNNDLITAVDGSDSYKINLVIKNKGAEQDYKYIVVARDKNGAAMSTHSGTISVDSEDNDFFTISDTKEAKEICIYVWESTAGMLIPVYGSPIKIK